MKIDIHVHTKKAKTGDADTRNIDVDKFESIIKSTEVKILAITNHNHFDKVQYEQFAQRLGETCQIWPGIELDIIEDDKRAHLIVIVNPKNYSAFSEKVESLLENKTPDNFTISIKDTVESFDGFDPIYIPHYFVKKPNLGDDGVELLMNFVGNNKRVLKEATNSISAGIYISHGHKSIYGSDVHDWDKYANISKELPDLRLPVESFEQFCFLLEKDDTTIQTILDKKIKEVVQVTPFTVAEQINMELYNDINIIFGSKGTGKTEILKALSQYYNEKGYKTSVYESNSTHLEDLYSVKGIELGIKLEDFGIETCKDEIQTIRESVEKEITSISKYRSYFSSVATNKISQKITIKDFVELDDSQITRKFKEVKDILLQFRKFHLSVGKNTILEEVIGNELFEGLIEILEKILIKLESESEKRFFDSKSVIMFNSLINTFVSEISKKTGQPEKPIKTGFQQYASNRIKIERTINKILANIDTSIEPLLEYVGDLGDKGDLNCKTNVRIQDGRIIDSKLEPVKTVYKTPQKEVAKSLRTISKYVYSNKLFEKIAELTSIEGGTTIESLYDLLLFNRYFVVGDLEYKPSNGESSMILLHNELKAEKDIYFIDEPEKSLGNDYINDVIVPMLKMRASQGKKVVIATHDANIAVRTLPYSSTYRQHNLDNYYTFIGNPFTNNLVCLTGDKPDLDWKNTSMKTLEGGRDAFGERGKIYGNF
jgi:predicted ATPase